MNLRLNLEVYSKLTESVRHGFEKDSIEALRKTRDALNEIEKQLKPFLRDLTGDADGSAPDAQDKVKTAQASMAIALAMGTLRYMGARLRGLDQGRKPDDPLRKELNSMRVMMRNLQKKVDASKEKKKEATKRKADEKSEKEPPREPASKRRKSS